jgi:hypothetical protein
MSDTERTVLIRNWHHCAGYLWMVLFKIHLMMFLCRTVNGRYWYGTDTTAPDMCEWFYLKYIWWCFYVGHWTDCTGTSLVSVNRPLRSVAGHAADLVCRWKWNLLTVLQKGTYRRILEYLKNNHIMKHHVVSWTVTIFCSLNQDIG